MAKQVDKFSDLRRRPKGLVKLTSPRDLPILLLLHYRAMYAVEVAAAYDYCFGDCKPGGMYGTLHKLKRLGLIEQVKRNSDGVLRLTDIVNHGGAKYYTTTKKGDDYIEHLIGEALAAHKDATPKAPRKRRRRAA